MIIILLSQPSMYPFLHSFPFLRFFHIFVFACIHVNHWSCYSIFFERDRVYQMYSDTSSCIEKKETSEKFWPRQFDVMIYRFSDFICNRMKSRNTFPATTKTCLLFNEKNVRILFRPSVAILILKLVSYFFLSSSSSFSSHLCFDPFTFAFSAKVVLNLLDIYLSLNTCLFQRNTSAYILVV